MLFAAAAKAGWYGLMVRSSGPQIRGGEAAALCRISTHPVDCLDDRFDVLIAVDWENLHRFADEIPLDAASLLVGDPAQGNPPEVYAKSAARYEQLGIKGMAKAIRGSWPNMVVLGIAAGLIGLPKDTARAVVEKSLKKSREGLAPSLAAVEAGYEAAANIGGGAKL